VDSDSALVAHFQCTVKTFIAEYGNLMSSFRVEVQDRSGFVDSTSSAISGADTLLFPVAR